MMFELLGTGYSFLSGITSSLMKVGGKTKDLVTVSTDKLEAEPYKNIIYYRISAIYFGSTDPSSGL